MIRGYKYMYICSSMYCIQSRIQRMLSSLKGDQQPKNALKKIVFFLFFSSHLLFSLSCHHRQIPATGRKGFFLLINLPNRPRFSLYKTFDIFALSYNAIDGTFFDCGKSATTSAVQTGSKGDGMSETGRFWTSKYFYRQTTQKIVSFSSSSKGTLFLFSFYYITRVPHVFSFSNLLDHLNRCCLLERRNRLIITRFPLVRYSTEQKKTTNYNLFHSVVHTLVGRKNKMCRVGVEAIEKIIIQCRPRRRRH